MGPLDSAVLSILDPHKDSSLGYPVVALCYGDPKALAKQGQTFHELQKIISRVDVGVGKLRALVMGMGRN